MNVSLQNLSGTRRIAVIGSGISGLSAAWLLKNEAQVSLFEADARFGGHSHTYRVAAPEGEVAVDTGFMVFNRPNYPLLTKMFEQLQVETYPTDMSFAVSLDAGRLEYAGSNLNTLFAQRSNLIRPSFLGMLRDILRFNRVARGLLREPFSVQESLHEFLDRQGLGRRFREDYLYPMAAAIWSCPRDKIGHFPAVSFARFFANHGLINLQDRPQWRTLVGGSASYVNKLLAELDGCVHHSQAVLAVQRREQGVELRFENDRVALFDEVVFACHSDQAQRLLQNPSPSEARMLQAVSYQPNRVLLHTDPKLMPQRRSVWSSWNYLGGQGIDGERAVSVSYWMNSLQNLATDTDFFVSLNPLQEPDPTRVMAEFCYEHPVFDAHSLELPQRLAAVQGRDRIWYAGAWTGYGFHEDGMRSGVDVAQRLGAKLPWEMQFERSRALVQPNATLTGEAA